MPKLQDLEADEAEADKLIAAAAGTQNADEGAGDEPKPDEQAGDAGAGDGESAPPEPDAKKDDAVTQQDDDLRAQFAELSEKFAKLQAAHDTLRGKTYAEVPRVLAENKALQDRVRELEAQLAEKQAEPVTPAAPSAKASEILTRIKTKVDDDVADQIQELITAEVEERVSARVGKVEGSVEGLRKTAAQLAEDRYLTRLTELVPDWREVAADPGYAAFLGTRDELSGVQLHAMAMQALESLDAERQARFFKRYKSLNAREGSKEESGAATTRPAPKAGKEALMAPKGTARSGREDAGEKPDYITVKQMEQYNREFRAHKYTDEEERKIQARLDRAIQNGWIVP